MGEFQIQRGKHKIMLTFSQGAAPSVEDLLVKILSEKNG